MSSATHDNPRGVHARPETDCSPFSNPAGLPSISARRWGAPSHPFCYLPAFCFRELSPIQDATATLVLCELLPPARRGSRLVFLVSFTPIFSRCRRATP